MIFDPNLFQKRGLEYIRNNPESKNLAKMTDSDIIPYRSELYITVKIKSRQKGLRGFHCLTVILHQETMFQAKKQGLYYLLRHYTLQQST